MTEYSKLNLEDDKKDEGIIAPVFTHEVGAHGEITKNDGIAQDWDHVALLPYKRSDKYQFLVWDDNKGDFFVLLAKEKGNQF